MAVETERWREAVSATIRAERAARRLTQDEMVTRTGIPKPTYLRYERGQRLPDLAILASIANDALGVPLSTLVALVAARADAGSITVKQGGGESVRIGGLSHPTPQNRSSHG